MANDKDYLSEFESEFEIDNFSNESEGSNYSSEESEYESEYELENDLSSETNEESSVQDEYELDNEFESPVELESNDEYEFEYESPDSEYESPDSEYKNYLQEYDSRDREFENRLYSAMSGEYESSFEMEQEIDRVLYEMEIEYFWKKAKNFLKKHKNKIMKVANLTPFGGSISALAKLAGGDVRGFLKKGAMMAANAYLPGVGGMVAGKLLNSETPNTEPARAQAQQVVAVAKDAYKNMAQLLPNIKPGNIPNQISRFSRQAVAVARKKHSRSRSGGRARKIIRLRPGSIVVVKL